MKIRGVRTLSLTLACGLLRGLASVAAVAPEAGTLEDVAGGIHWLGHDAFRLEVGGKILYVDPWQIAGGPEADLVLITHDHQDHCSPADVAKIRGPKTRILAVQAAAAKLPPPVSIVKPGDRLDLGWVRVEVVPAYNVNKFRSPGVPFHPREASYAGYLLTLSEITVYHAGDSDQIPEMGAFKADIALLPVSGIYVMTAEEAASAAEQIKPRLAIPMHVGRGIGSLADAERFRKKAKVPVKILPME